MEGSEEDKINSEAEGDDVDMEQDGGAMSCDDEDENTGDESGSDGYIESLSEGEDVDGDAESKNPAEIKIENATGEENKEKVDTAKKKKKKKNKIKTGKVGPQRQIRLIHTLLKKAKIYEIRKLTRRMNMLKSAKGNEEQLAKNKRKAERFGKEVEAIRGFMIDQLADRTVGVFKGKGEAVYDEIWKSCADPTKTNDMLQILSNKEGDNHDDIAYLRMLSSKDLVGKFQQIASGENLSTKKKEEDKQKGGKKNKQEKPKPKTKTTVKINKPTIDTQRDGKSNDIGSESKENLDKNHNAKVTTKNESKNSDSSIAEKTKKGPVIEEKKVKKMKRDEFFIDHTVEVSDDENDVSEEEFTAPVMHDIQNPDIQNAKKNRMGQRDRKRLQDKKYGREPEDEGQWSSGGFQGRGGSQRGRGWGQSRGRGGGQWDRGSSRGRGGRGQSRGRGRGQSFDQKPNRQFNNRGDFGSQPKIQASEKKEVDKNLHPSWQAKQRQKAQQNISGFAGTKITFDD